MAWWRATGVRTAGGSTSGIDVRRSIGLDKPEHDLIAGRAAEDGAGASCVRAHGPHLFTVWQ